MEMREREIGKKKGANKNWPCPIWYLYKRIQIQVERMREKKSEEKSKISFGYHSVRLDGDA